MADSIQSILSRGPAPRQVRPNSKKKPGPTGEMPRTEYLDLPYR
jgi:hypothetical protein